MHRRGRVLVLGLALGLVALYALYLAAANLYLRSGRLQRALSRRPEVARLDYDSAWTVFPGRIHVRGFRLLGETRNIQWWLALDRATLDVVVPRLLRREFVAADVTGDGIALRVARRADAAVPWSTDPRLRPSIPGLANPPRPAPEARYPVSPPPPPGKAWRIQLSGIDITGLREIWIEAMRWTGGGRVTGSFDLLIRRRLTLGPSRVEIAGGDLVQGSAPIVAGLHGAIEGSSEPYDPVADAGRPALRHLDGRARLAGRLAGLGFLAPLLRPVAGLAVEAAGPLDLDLRLARGRFDPGTRAEVRAEAVRVGILDYRATGAGRVGYRVAAEGKRPWGEIAVVVDRFALERLGYRGPYARGRGLRLTARSSPPGVDSPFTPTALDVAIPAAEVPDFSYYNAYLPRGSGIVLRGGRGRLQGALSAAAPAWTGRADLRLDGDDLTADVLGARLRGRLTLRTHVARLDLARRRFDLAGSDLALSGVSVAAPASAVQVAPGWWARARIERGELTPGRPVFLTATARATVRDAGPLLAVMTPKNRVLGWLDRRLAEKAGDVRAEVAGRLGQSLVEVDRLDVAGGPLALQGRLRFAGGGRRGALLASYGRLAVGLELAGDERHVKLLGARQWFAAQR
jgi:hypothetical protein